jgi:hypothetical protein
MVRIHQVIPAALASLLREQPLSPGKVRFAWRAAVGQRGDRVSSIAIDRAGTLVVKVADGYWAREFERHAPLIRTRLETLLGAGVVRRLAIEVEKGSHHA